jgi:hypothetical protein
VRDGERHAAAAHFDDTPASADTVIDSGTAGVIGEGAGDAR